jgi:site-specific DNA-cytosine methylase
LKILVACEESQAVTIELRRLGHEAYSCDIIPCSGGYPEWHIMQDVLPLLNGKCEFYTTDGVRRQIDTKWDMIIAFPPCTHLAVSGAAWFEQKRKDGRQQQGIDFFMKSANADCDCIAIENPVGIMSTHWRKPDQIIHPWQFGHPEKKSTCLWLKGLPLLQPTKDVSEYMKTLPKNKQERLHYLPPSLDRSKLRSKTFLGIARAMAEQWAGEVFT